MSAIHADFTDAACRPYVFTGRDLWHGDGREHHRSQAARIDEARRICATCPLIEPCARAARELGEEAAGVWAGTVPEERSGTPYACAEKRGTVAGRQRHRRAGQKVCPECRDAWNERKARDEGRAA